eukprot:1160435-Pelagomonas_calceolata.AAC.4
MQELLPPVPGMAPCSASIACLTNMQKKILLGAAPRAIIVHCTVDCTVLVGAFAAPFAAPYSLLHCNAEGCASRHCITGQLWIIDVSQSVDLDHPKALDFLREDCKHINHYFRTKGKASGGSRAEKLSISSRLHSRVHTWACMQVLASCNFCVPHQTAKGCHTDGTRKHCATPNSQGVPHRWHMKALLDDKEGNRKLARKKKASLWPCHYGLLLLAGVAVLTVRELFEFAVDPLITEDTLDAALDRLMEIATSRPIGEDPEASVADAVFEQAFIPKRMDEVRWIVNQPTSALAQCV